MKEKHQLIGSGCQAAENLLTCIAEKANARLKSDEDGFVLHFTTNGKRILIAHNPNSNEFELWKDRLLWLDKQAAIYLNNAPLLYSALWENTKQPSKDKKVLRFAFGLSLSIGRPLRRRYTAIFSLPDRRILLSNENELSPSSASSGNVISGLPNWAEEGFELLVPKIEEASRTYSSLPEVQQHLSELARARKNELWQLDHLYKRKQGLNDKLYGFPIAGEMGSAAIRAEIMNCQKLILERYKVRIILEPLSLGILEGSVPFPKD